MLYQAGALIRTIDECFQPGSEIDPDNLIAQTDRLILGVVETLEGAQEVEITRLLLRLRSLLSEDAKRGMLSPQASAAQAEIVNVVNNFFYDKLTGVPTIREYITDLQEAV
jgi:hypothetical protein